MRTVTEGFRCDVKFHADAKKRTADRTDRYLFCRRPLKNSSKKLIISPNNSITKLAIELPVDAVKSNDKPSINPSLFGMAVHCVPYYIVFFKGSEGMRIWRDNILMVVQAFCLNTFSTRNSYLVRQRRCWFPKGNCL